MATMNRRAFMRGILGGAAAAVIIPRLGIDPAPVEAAPPPVAPPGTFTLMYAGGLPSRPMRLDAPLSELQRGINDLFDANPPVLSYWGHDRTKKHFDMTTFEAGGKYRQRLSIPVAACAAEAPTGPMIVTFAGENGERADLLKKYLDGYHAGETAILPANVTVYRPAVATGVTASGIITKAAGPVIYQVADRARYALARHLGVRPDEVTAEMVEMHRRFMVETQGGW
jgi:hypothetical protein